MTIYTRILSQSKRGSFFFSSSPFIRPPRRMPNLRPKDVVPSRPSPSPLTIFQRSSHSGKIIRSPRFPSKRVAGALSPASVISRVLLVSLSTLPNPSQDYILDTRFTRLFSDSCFEGTATSIYIYKTIGTTCTRESRDDIDTYHLSLLL